MRFRLRPGHITLFPLSGPRSSSTPFAVYRRALSPSIDDVDQCVIATYD